MGSNKRAPIPYNSDRTKNFLKSWKKLNNSGRFDMVAAAQAMCLVIMKQPLPAEYSDHALTGNYEGFRELHIGGDFLLIYRIDKNSDTVFFTDIGTHAELFD